MTVTWTQNQEQFPGLARAHPADPALPPSPQPQHRSNPGPLLGSRTSPDAPDHRGYRSLTWNAWRPSRGCPQLWFHDRYHGPLFAPDHSSPADDKNSIHIVDLVSKFLSFPIVKLNIYSIKYCTSLTSMLVDPASSEFSNSSLTTLTTDVMTWELDRSRTVSGGSCFMVWTVDESWV